MTFCACFNWSVLMEIQDLNLTPYNPHALWCKRKVCLNSKKTSFIFPFFSEGKKSLITFPNKAKIYDYLVYNFVRVYIKRQDFSRPKRFTPFWMCRAF